MYGVRTAGLGRPTRAHEDAERLAQALGNCCFLGPIRT